MDSIKYFNTYKEKILETAKYLCNSQNQIDIDNKFLELKEEYYNNIGTKHEEIIYSKNNEIIISSLLETIRFEEIEIFKIYAIISGEIKEVFVQKGNRFSCNIIQFMLDEILLKLYINNDKQSIHLYIVHNHPFKYMASPSPADAQTFDTITHNVYLIRDKVNKNIEVNIEFGIVTYFDYWSLMQS